MYTLLRRITSPPIRSLVWCAPLILLSACGREPHAHFPLASGKQWDYAISTTVLDETRVARTVVRNLGRGRDDTGNVFVQRNHPHLDRKYRVTELGIERDEADGSRLLLPTDTEIGKSWSVDSRLAFIESRTFARQDKLRGRLFPFELTFEIVQNQATVDVPAGTFENCLQIEGRGNTTVRTDRGNAVAHVSVAQTDWFAPGVGLVKSVRVESSESPFLKDGSYTQELLQVDP